MIARTRRPLGLIEQRMRAGRRTRSRVSQGAPVEQHRIFRMQRDLIAENIAGIPRRPLFKVPAYAGARLNDDVGGRRRD